ncbi:dTDP-4-dehydrorhamnose 3,5-epimerase [Algiphilus sp.]|uniref:dTDP-4-dehydrorhamnose 3,5-epimerase n=1 Tax=Algiphilus sp. TaxID=1872431 RepID=UPI0032EC53A1
MHSYPTSLADVMVIEPSVFGDDRGWFMESFNERSFHECIGKDKHFVQDNHSFSRRGVLRGLHYQLGAHPQGKLVRVVRGEVFDVAVDIRNQSPTFGAWTGVHLSASNRLQLWVPEGFAHGFLVLSDEAEVIYKVTDWYDREGERSIRWDDPAIGIQWPLDGNSPILATKDAIAPTLDTAEVFLT